MREYTFVRGNGDKKVIEARSLKKAIIKKNSTVILLNLKKMKAVIKRLWNQ